MNSSRYRCPKRRTALAVGALTLLAPLAYGQEFRPNLGPDLSSVTVRCGDLTLLIRQKSQWTPGRIDYRGSAMTTEKSAYGTVFSFPGIGFIGTAHLENEPEKLESLSFFLGGRETPAKAEMKGESFRFDRTSRIRDFSMQSRIELKDNRLIETTTVSTDKEVPLKLVYHFMHAWNPSCSAFLAGVDDSPTQDIKSDLKNHKEVNRKMYIQKKVDWIAIYEPDSEQFAVSRILEAPESGQHISMIWNVGGTYRKYYLKCFDNETVPAHFKGTWKMVTAFGASSAKNWEAAAVKLAKSLQNK